MPGLRLGSPPHLVDTWRRDITDAWGEGMTEEEHVRFALVLKECERICAMTAQDEAAALANDSSDGIPIVVAPAEVQMAVPL